MIIDEAAAQVMYELLENKGTTLTRAERILATTISKSYNLRLIPVKVPDWVLWRINYIISDKLERTFAEEGACKVHCVLIITEDELRLGKLDENRLVQDLHKALGGKIHQWRVTTESRSDCIIVKIVATRGTL
jgi:heterodisulfide reductase subunit B